MAKKLLFLLSFLLLTSSLMSMTSEAIPNNQRKRCSVCRHQNIGCQPDCVLRPYFPPDQPEIFSKVHRLFTIKTLEKMLDDIPKEKHDDLMTSIKYEADARKRSPVHGALGYILQLQENVNSLEAEYLLVQNKLDFYRSAGNSNSAAAVSSNSTFAASFDPAAAASFDPTVMASFSPVSTAAAATFNPGYNPTGDGELPSSGFRTSSSNLTTNQTEETMPSLEITDVQQPLHTTNDPSLRSLTATENDNNENATVDLLPTPESSLYSRRNDDGNPFL